MRTVVRICVGLLVPAIIGLIVWLTWDWGESARHAHFAFVNSIGAFVASDISISEVSMPSCGTMFPLLAGLVFSTIFAYLLMEDVRKKNTIAVSLGVLAHLIVLVLLMHRFSVDWAVRLFDEELPAYEYMWAGRLTLAFAMWALSYAIGVICLVVRRRRGS